MAVWAHVQFGQSISRLVPVDSEKTESSGTGCSKHYWRIVMQS